MTTHRYQPGPSTDYMDDDGPPPLDRIELTAELEALVKRMRSFHYVSHATVARWADKLDQIIDRL